MRARGTNIIRLWRYRAQPSGTNRSIRASPGVRTAWIAVALDIVAGKQTHAARCLDPALPWFGGAARVGAAVHLKDILPGVRSGQGQVTRTESSKRFAAHQDAGPPRLAISHRSRGGECLCAEHCVLERLHTHPSQSLRARAPRHRHHPPHFRKPLSPRVCQSPAPSISVCASHVTNFFFNSRWAPLLAWALCALP